jgi:hypothetical protein
MANAQQRRRLLEAYDPGRGPIAGPLLVLSPLTVGGVTYPRGAVLPADLVAVFSAANLRALITNRLVEPTNERKIRHG